MSARRTALSLFAALTLLAAACSGDEGDDPAEQTTTTDETDDDSKGDRDDSETSAEPLFERDLDATFLGRGIYSAPVIVLPATDGLPWTLGGWQHDPKRLQSTATVWESLDARTWFTVPLPDADPEIASETLVDVAVHAGERWAIGSLGQADGIGLWTTHGAEWDLVETDGLDGGVHPYGIASSGKGLLVWGTTASGTRPVFFTSRDGESFDRLDDRIVEGDSRGVSEVAWTSAGWVAVGWIAEGEATTPAVWTSTDADEWARVDLPTTGSTRSWASSIVVGPTGILVGGSLSQGGQPGLPVAWRSTDGTTWEDPVSLILHDDGRTTSGDLDVRALSTDGTTIVAAGGSDWRPHVWTSTDGGTWQLAPNPVSTAGFEQGVIPSAVGIAAGTTVFSSSAPATFVLDGDRWTEVGRSSGAITAQTEWPYAYAAAAGPDGGLVLVGSVSNPAGPGQDPVDTPIVWTEGDGWTRTTLPALGGFAAAVTTGPAGLLAVGAEDFATAARSAGDHNPDAIVWHSTDATTWSFLTPGSTFAPDADRSDPEVMAAYRATQGLLGGAGTQRLEAVVALGDGFVAGGTNYSSETGTSVDPWVVSSTDRLDGAVEQVQEPVAGDQHLNGLCTDGTVVLAVGGAEDPNGQGDSAAWRRSADGTWATADVSALRAVGYDLLTDCVHDGERFIAVGSLSDGELTFPVIATSTDGRAWTWVEIDEERDADTWSTALAPLEGGGALIVGDDIAEGDVVVWHLTGDGELERIDTGDDALAAPESQSAYAVAVLAGEVAIVGGDVGGIGVWRSSALFDRLVG